MTAQLPERVSILWRGPEACPAPPRLDAEVELLVGPRAAAGAARPQFEAEVEVREQGGYVLKLRVRDGSKARRRLELATCAQVHEATVLLVATALDPSAVLRAPTLDEPAPAAPPAAPLRRPSYADGARWSLLFGGFFDRSSLPGVSGGPALGALLSLGRVRLSSHVRYLVQRSHEAPELDVVSELDLFVGSLGASMLWPLGPFLLGPSGEAEFGLLRARSQGPDDATRQRAPWGGALLGATLAYAASARVGVELGLYAGIPLWRTALAVQREEELMFYTSASYTTRVSLALRVALGPKD